MAGGSIGEQELALLRYVTDRGGATVGEVAEGYGTPRGLARSTVLTMMERLRRKGHLARRVAQGVYRYEAKASSAELLRTLVGRFVEGHLGGSVSPFVAYLTENPTVSDEDLAELQGLVEKLQSRRKKAGP